MKTRLFIIMICSLAVMPLGGQTFSEVDFERLLMNHPMMKNYDASTGHFNNTPHALLDVKKLKAENKALEKELKELKKKTRTNAKSMAVSEIDDEEAFWGRVTSLEGRIKEAEYKIARNKELISSGGDPGYTKLFPIVDEMCNDLFVPLYNKDRVVLNKLPRYYIDKSNLKECDFRIFWRNPNAEALEKYLSFAPVISMLFPKSDRTILYQKSGENK